MNILKNPKNLERIQKSEKSTEQNSIISFAGWRMINYFRAKTISRI